MCVVQFLLCVQIKIIVKWFVEKGYISIIYASNTPKKKMKKNELLIYTRIKEESVIGFSLNNFVHCRYAIQISVWFHDSNWPNFTAMCMCTWWFYQLFYNYITIWSSNFEPIVIFVFQWNFWFTKNKNKKKTKRNYINAIRTTNRSPAQNSRTECELARPIQRKPVANFNGLDFGISAFQGGWMS